MTEYKPHNITFYPEYNAFSISPAPKHDNDPDSGKRETFKWKFDNCCELKFDWRTNKNASNVYLQFSRHPNDLNKSTRIFPFEVYKDNKWQSADTIANEDDKRNGKYRIAKDEKIRITKHVEGARWSFNFYCEIDGKSYPVDPEMRTGTNPK